MYRKGRIDQKGCAITKNGEKSIVYIDKAGVKNNYN